MIRTLRSALTLLAFAGSVSTLSAASATGGDLDPKFGSGGRVVTDLGANAVAFGAAVQRDGKVVVAGGRGDDFVLVRYRRDGRLDTTFGGDGTTVTDFGGVDTARDVAVQRDGRLVAAGGSDSRFALARYTRDGALDRSFGRGGMVATDFGRPAGAHSVLLRPNGTIVAAGSASGFALARYRSDGSLDRSFGSAGTVLTNVGVGSTDAALGPSGDIVAVGNRARAGASGGTERRVFVVARYHADGALDHGFGRDGIVATDLGVHACCAFAVSVQPDGRTVVGGHGHPALGTPGGIVLVRYTRDGTLDRSFGGSNGRAFSGIALGVAELAIDPGGRFVVAAEGGSSTLDFVVARFQTNGKLDRRFGTRGVATTDFGGDEIPWALALQPDGKIVAAGAAFSGETEPPQSDVALARYLPSACIVPDLSGRRLSAATPMLAAAGCRLGRVERRYARGVRRGHIASQRPRAGTKLREDARVAVVVSRGARP